MSTLTGSCNFLPNKGSVKTYFLIFIAAFWLLVHIPLEAQRQKNKFKKGGVIQLNDSLTSYGQSDIFNFPNIHTTKYYHDANKLSRIKGLEAAGAYEEHYAMLKEYVSNFGICNFATDIKLIWDLAKLSEKEGPPGEAVLLYKLLLKHYALPAATQKIQSEYDTLTKKSKRSLRSAETIL